MKLASKVWKNSKFWGILVLCGLVGYVVVGCGGGPAAPLVVFEAHGYVKDFEAQTGLNGLTVTIGTKQDVTETYNGNPGYYSISGVAVGDSIVVSGTIGGKAYQLCVPGTKVSIIQPQDLWVAGAAPQPPSI